MTLAPGYGETPPDPEEADALTAQARALLGDDFAAAVVQGSRLDQSARQVIAERLEQLTGISAEKHLKSLFLMSKPAFCEELLAESGEVLGGNDARYRGAAADESTGEADADPGLARVAPGFTAGVARQVHGVLGIGFDTEYRIADQDAAGRWEWDVASSRKLMMMGKPSPFHTYPYVAELTRYLKQVPEARLFIGTGYYDPLTTVGAVEHLLRQYELPLDRVTDRRYEGGHMMYTDPGRAHLTFAC